jgi:ParB-like chromosome segregation protein Spo0J
MVKRFAEQMRSGAVFPAIVVNDHGELVDGNTRCAAARRNGRETVAAYICSGLSPLQARSLSVELNQSHGLSMTGDELRAFVLGAVQEGQSLDTRSCARMTGVTPSTLSRWVAAAQFRVRAERCGIPPSNTAVLSESARAALQVARLRSVFVEATDLAIAARVPAAQLMRMMAEANSAPSEGEALRIVATERQSRVQDIEAIAQGFKAEAKRRNRHSVTHMRALLKDDIDTILDVAPDRHHETFEALSKLQRHLNAILVEATRRWRLSEVEMGTGASLQHPRHDPVGAGAHG